MQNVTLTTTPRRALEFGIYRDGDNNLDDSQSAVLDQAAAVSKADRSIEFSVENTTHTFDGDIETHDYRLDGGTKHASSTADGVNMSSPSALAAFVACTLDNAEASGAKQTWIDLVDHGAGDGGGLEADTFGGVMPMEKIAQAIALGEKMHAQEHPEDGDRRIDGVVANQCLMASMGFADELSRAGVKYLAASPETMLSPGVPSTVAEAIAQHVDDPTAMARGVVNDVMHTRYGGAQGFGPAAAFDVLDLDPKNIRAAEQAVKTFNDAAASAASKNADVRSALRDDVKSIDGMVRFPDATADMPWHADRPAISVFSTIAADTRLDASLRSEARDAADTIGSLVLAHKESRDFAPFGGSSYSDAAGPTIHDPLTRKQIDPWAPAVSETSNAFYDAVDQAKFARVIA